MLNQLFKYIELFMNVSPISVGYCWLTGIYFSFLSAFGTSFNTPSWSELLTKRAIMFRGFPSFRLLKRCTFCKLILFASSMPSSVCIEFTNASSYSCVCSIPPKIKLYFMECVLSLRKFLFSVSRY